MNLLFRKIIYRASRKNGISFLPVSQKIKRRIKGDLIVFLVSKIHYGTSAYLLKKARPFAGEKGMKGRDEKHGETQRGRSEIGDGSKKSSHDEGESFFLCSIRPAPREFFVESCWYASQKYRGELRAKWKDLWLSIFGPRGDSWSLCLLKVLSIKGVCHLDY